MQEPARAQFQRVGRWFVKRGRQRERRRKKGRGERGGGEGRSGTRSLKWLTLEQRINNSPPLFLGRLMFHLVRSKPLLVFQVSIKRFILFVDIGNSVATKQVSFM